MESSETLKILLDMLRANVANAIASAKHVLPIDREQLDEALKSALETVREDVMGKFELVPKADYEAQIALINNMRAQLQDLEQRLDDLEQHRPDST